MNMMIMLLLTRKQLLKMFITAKMVKESKFFRCSHTIDVVLYHNAACGLNSRIGVKNWSKNISAPKEPHSFPLSVFAKSLIHWHTKVFPPNIFHTDISISFSRLVQEHADEGDLLS